jgi:hypothetical protein
VFERYEKMWPIKAFMTQRLKYTAAQWQKGNCIANGPGFGRDNCPPSVPPHQASTATATLATRTSASAKGKARAREPSTSGDDEPPVEKRKRKTNARERSTSGEDEPPVEKRKRKTKAREPSAFEDELLAETRKHSTCSKSTSTPRVVSMLSTLVDQ